MTLQHMLNKPPIILASRSPRRIELLSQMGLSCEVIPADIDESTQQDESAVDYVSRLAKQKALAVMGKLRQSHRHILAADTTVALNGIILGKPENAKEAEYMLQQLSGRQHEVHTAITVCCDNDLKTMTNTTRVELTELTEKMIANYIASGEYRDKAGSYGIQGLAGAWIKRIEGSYSGVMGLPLYETAKLLAEMGY